MGYFITDHKEGEKLDALSNNFLVATDEEVRVAEYFLDSECDDFLSEIEKKLPDDIAKIICKKFLVYYIKVVKDWMNTPLGGINLFGRGYRPSETEESVRRIFTKMELRHSVDEPYKIDREYFFYKIPDDEVIEFQGKFDEKSEKPSEDGLIPIGEKAFYLIDYEDIVPVTVTDRIGFVFYCEDSDRNQYIVPFHQLFNTEAEAQSKIAERNNRRDAAIEKYHLLIPTTDKHLDHNRHMALEWLYYNQDPPELLAKELEDSIREKQAC